MIATPTLRVLCRTLAQLEAAAQFGITNLIADFQDIREYRDAVKNSVSRHNKIGARPLAIYLATPRIQKPGEAGIFRAMAKHGASGFLVRNLAGHGVLRRARHSVRSAISRSMRPTSGPSTTCVSAAPSA